MVNKLVLKINYNLEAGYVLMRSLILLAWFKSSAMLSKKQDINKKATERESRKSK